MGSTIYAYHVICRSIIRQSMIRQIQQPLEKQTNVHIPQITKFYKGIPQNHLCSGSVLCFLPNIITSRYKYIEKSRILGIIEKSTETRKFAYTCRYTSGHLINP